MNKNLWKPIALAILTASLLMGCSRQSVQGMTITSSNDSAAVLAEDLPATSAEAGEVDNTEAKVTSEDDSDVITRPDGWTEKTHSKTAEPDYDVVFPQDEVNRIDITIDPETWQTMVDDLAGLYGSVGSPAAGGERINRGTQQQPLDEGDAIAVEPPAQLPARAAQDGGNAPAPPAMQDEQNAPEGATAVEPPAQRPERAAQAGDNAPALRTRGMGEMPGGNLSSSDDNPIWVPVTVTFEGDEWTSVGMRFKGNSSLRSTLQQGVYKIPFRLDFDQFEDEFPEIDDQRFYGFQKVTFSSNYRDNSLLREKVAADLFREAGVTAANTAFYEVYVDTGDGPVYFGLYTMVEVIEDTVIEEQFEDDDGNAYKPEGTGATFAAGSFNEASFDKQTNEDEADWSDIEALFEALHADTRTTDPDAWRAELEAVFDVDGFLNYLAVNQVIQNWDTYGTMSHNYYLYHDPTSDLLTWIPWDNNEALGSGGGGRGTLSIALDEVNAKWPLIRYLLDDEVYQATYVAYVDNFINTVFDPEEMAQTYRSLASLIEPSVLAENEGYTMLRSDAEFYDAIDTLIAHAAQRYEVAATYVAGW